MRRVLAVILVVCCLLSGAAVAISPPEATDVGSVTPTPNATASLAIAPAALETTAYRRVTLDVSSTLALDSQQLDGRFEQRLLDERAGRINATSARRAQLERTAERIETGISDLRKRQSAAVRGYNNGSLAPKAFVVELASIDAAAGRLKTAASRVAERARPIPDARIDGQPAANWARNRGIELGPLEGPVRDHIRETLRGENTMQVEETTGLDEIGQTRDRRLEPFQVYVETSKTGVVLAAVDDGRYYREAFLPSVRNTTTGDEITGIGDVSERVSERYPWASNHSSTSRSAGDRRAGVYRFTLYHDHGRLMTYLNRTSGRVFAEQQETKLSSVPTATPVTKRANGLRLRVNRTHSTGPLELSLSNPEGEPVDGRITVANQSVGRTGSDGELWTVTPRGSYAVVANANEGTVRIETNATPPTTARTTNRTSTPNATPTANATSTNTASTATASAAMASPHPGEG